VKCAFIGYPPFGKPWYPDEIDGEDVNAVAPASQRSCQDFFPVVRGEMIEREVDRNDLNLILVPFVELLDDFMMGVRNIVDVVQLLHRTFRREYGLERQVDERDNGNNGDDNGDQPDWRFFHDLRNLIQEDLPLFFSRFAAGARGVKHDPLILVAAATGRFRGCSRAFLPSHKTAGSISSLASPAGIISI